MWQGQTYSHKPNKEEYPLIDKLNNKFNICAMLDFRTKVIIFTHNLDEVMTTSALLMLTLKLVTSKPLHSSLLTQYNLNDSL